MMLYASHMNEQRFSPLVLFFQEREPGADQQAIASGATI
jgi:hypothetical protein